MPPPDSQLLDVTALFGRPAPLEVDLGCGDGSFLSQLAVRHPERNFLGVERLVGRSGGACKRIERLQLANARIFRGDIPQFVEQLLAPGSVDVFHLMFPDPWPKRRHHCRRVFRAELVQGISRALTIHGTLRIATDDTPYFREIERVLASARDFEFAAPGEDVSLPVSTFEKRFVDSSVEIHRLLLRKVSSPR